MKAYITPLASAGLILLTCLIFKLGLLDGSHTMFAAAIYWVFGVFLFMVSPCISAAQVAYGIKGIYHSKRLHPLYAVQVGHTLWLGVWVHALITLWPALMGI